MHDEATDAGIEPAAAERAVALLYHHLMTGLVLTLVTQRGPDAAERFLFAHFRRQHEEKFLDGLAKLGLDKLPHAVACAQYHYLSNKLGGVKTEYVYESDRKAWVRYPPPRWIWNGTAVSAIPSHVSAAMMHGWHGNNGVTLGNPRLGFVCTGQTVDGHPGLEGYYFEYDRDLAPHERVRFAYDERCPRRDAASEPVLDDQLWTPARLAKVHRNYAMEYVRSLIPVLTQLFGDSELMPTLGRAARLIGMQFYDEACGEMNVTPGGSPTDFAVRFLALAKAQGEDAVLVREGDRVVVRQRGWRLMRGVEPVPPQAVDAWNELWAGMLAVHDRFLKWQLSPGDVPSADGGDLPVFEWSVSE